MNGQKDTQKNKQTNHIKGYSGHTVRNDKDTVKQDDFMFIIKKTEKIVTALYLVTECMDTDDAIKMRMRLCGVDLLSLVHKLPVLSPVEKHTELTLVKMKVSEVSSLVDISATIGFVSEMNARILTQEFRFLLEKLELHQSGIGSFDQGYSVPSSHKISEFVLSPDMLRVDTSIAPSLQPKTSNTENGVTYKKPLMSVINSKGPMGYSQDKNTNFLDKGHLDKSIVKEDRSNKIKEIIKDNDKGEGVSIKDISISFPELSEKTIQRELNNLVSLNKVKRVGDKRWSKYQLVVSI